MPKVWRILLAASSALQVCASALVVNEVYFRTTGSTYRNQWIELYNETSESAELRSFAIGTGVKRKPLISWREGSSVKLPGLSTYETRLAPGAYALILDRTYSGEEILDAPAGTQILTVGDASLGESVFLRTNDTLSLYEKSGPDYRLVESVPLYTTAHGYSLERGYAERLAEGKNFSHSILLRGAATSPGRPNTTCGLCEDAPAVRIALRGLAGSRLAVGCPFLAELRLETGAERSAWPADGECLVDSEGFLDLVPVDAGLKALREKGTLHLPIRAGRSAAFQILATSPGVTSLRVSARGLEKNLELRAEEAAGSFNRKLFVNEVFFRGEKAAHWLELFSPQDVSIEKLRVDFWNADLTSRRSLFYRDVFFRGGEYALLGNSGGGLAKYFPASRSRLRAHADFELYTEGLVVLSEETPLGPQTVETILYKNLTEEVKDGQSVERRSVEFPALSSSQWKSCSFTNGGSPGEANSPEKIADFEWDLRRNTLRFTGVRDEEFARLRSSQDGSLKPGLFQMNGRPILPSPRVLQIAAGETLVLPQSYLAESLGKFRGNLILQFSFSPSRGPVETRRFVLEVLE